MATLQPENTRAGRPEDHAPEVREAYGLALGGSSIRERYAGAAGRIHLLEKGTGPPLVLLHGTGLNAACFLPLLDALEGVRAIAPDRPGQGLSDAVDLPPRRYFEAAVAWIDGLLDALDLPVTVLLGHSAGGVWGLRYALARPERIARLVLIGPPALPKTRCPLPYRLIATPGIGRLLPWLAPPSPASVLQFASFMGEKDTLSRHPQLIDLIVAAGRDPLAASVDSAEARVLVSPFALVSPRGFRHRSRVRHDELRRLRVPTLLIWGEREPLGGVSVAREVVESIPEARLEVLPGGHVPWLGHPDATAAAVLGFMGRRG